MRGDRSTIWRLVLLSILGLFVLTGCGSSGGERPQASNNRVSGDAQFPVPPEIQGNVDFWRNVYGVWSRGEVAFHDDEHMDVIYEVARLPGSIHDGYTAAQKDWVRARTAYHKDRVRSLQERVLTRQPLTGADKELLAKFDAAGGTRALYGASDRVRSQRGLRERFRRGLEISGRYDPAFREIMRAHGVPEDLAYLPHVESSFQTNARSSVGAAGVWQFMPGTGKHYMDVNGTIDERLDPILAADGAARYLSQAHGKLRSWPLAITSYNHGQGGMANAKAMYGDDIGRIVRNYQGKSFKFASRNFYSEFVAAREVAKNPKRYFPEGVRYEEPWPHDRLVLRHSMPANHLARHYGVSTYSLADMNLHWRDPARNGSSYLPAGSTVWLPSGTTRRIASQPPPVPEPVLIASTEPKRAVAPAPQPEPRLAKLDRPAKAAKATRVAHKPTAKASAPRFHVVRPQETLYRVATENGLTVAELQRLNRMGPKDTHIRTGQKLKVGI